MQNASLLAMAGLIALQSATSAVGQDSKRPAVDLPKHEARLAYTVQTVSVRAGCFPERLRAVLSHIAAKTGRRPMITSGLRPHPRRHGSLHGKCLAADIRMPGLSERTIIAAAKTAPGIGGIGTYCNGIVHVDVGPQRRWVDC
ncbi:D-Ala-D-Ala carboxypeptidase family metallohydrolase [Rhizobium hidalgonense]|uniref:D-Ala-D-Ala carboxypeptidase family metallohydrolase n=1 Tax=Rhizobium hidalgonense TaxID=1538159 RepID=A0A2A6KH86_9HYPH|nr:D-Ala-D-Ala carboxypeptidase family metallohydrolase [Rhizobium hidalgonense]MDR9774175.1 D-Ala-D-Ala carboxypeptidase family metallohydrolase [Rhizobium hidalgonense]MDR9812065.1 D-Ala-D-Ala carboxypeptidase family metallohydrolase [Rhizobium hidalgonense]MDR9820537.1 D-Ala-D-Ala carboxypeptidase family metallohydrolase [Rhizobium hidalgonense]PDT23749.1 peptidase M15A [Rhizobium hidalgonense]PON03909.1 peptidase M15A [Rhizobium hidalgonense]